MFSYADRLQTFFDLISGCWSTQSRNIATYRTGAVNRAIKQETNSKSDPLTVFPSDTYLCQTCGAFIKASRDDLIY